MLSSCVSFVCLFVCVVVVFVVYVVAVVVVRSCRRLLSSSLLLLLLLFLLLLLLYGHIERMKTKVLSACWFYIKPIHVHLTVCIC